MKKTAYLFCLSAAGAVVMSMRLFGNAYSDRVQYQIEYQGQANTTLWAEYRITERDRYRSPMTEKLVGKSPQIISFSAPRNAIVSATGSTKDRTGVKIKIIKNGSECGNSGGLNIGLTEAIVCR
jgi:hypothetical protein